MDSQQLKELEEMVLAEFSEFRENLIQLKDFDTAVVVSEAETIIERQFVEIRYWCNRIEMLIEKQKSKGDELNV